LNMALEERESMVLPVLECHKVKEL
jgi:hypothetical protein